MTNARCWELPKRGVDANAALRRMHPCTEFVDGHGRGTFNKKPLPDCIGRGLERSLGSFALELVNQVQSERKRVLLGAFV